MQEAKSYDNRSYERTESIEECPLSRAIKKLSALANDPKATNLALLAAAVELQDAVSQAGEHVSDETWLALADPLRVVALTAFAGLVVATAASSK